MAPYGGHPFFNCNTLFSSVLLLKRVIYSLEIMVGESFFKQIVMHFFLKNIPEMFAW